MGFALWKDSHGSRRSCSSYLLNGVFTHWVRMDLRRSYLPIAYTNFFRYQVATGAGDDTIRIWDMRAIRSLYTIPAHVSNVSDVRFFHANDLHFRHTPSTRDVNMNGVDEAAEARDAPEKERTAAEEEWRYRSGLFFASAGYDGFVKLWSADDWQLLKRLSTDAGKVMSVDVSSDGNMLVSGTYNRNFQLFAPEEV